MPTPRRGPSPRGREGSVRGKGPEGKTQERYRHEIRPEGSGGRKPARGCKTLKSDGVGLGKPEVTGSPKLKALKGHKPQEKLAAACSVASRSDQTL